jgi:hypothetical protein
VHLADDARGPGPLRGELHGEGQPVADRGDAGPGDAVGEHARRVERCSGDGGGEVRPRARRRGVLVEGDEVVGREGPEDETGGADRAAHLDGVDRGDVAVHCGDPGQRAGGIAAHSSASTA